MQNNSISPRVYNTGIWATVLGSPLLRLNNMFPSTSRAMAFFCLFLFLNTTVTSQRFRSEKRTTNQQKNVERKIKQKDTVDFHLNIQKILQLMLLIYSFDRRSLNVLLHGPKTRVHAHFKHAGSYIRWGFHTELTQSVPPRDWPHGTTPCARSRIPLNNGLSSPTAH